MKEEATAYSARYHLYDNHPRPPCRFIEAVESIVLGFHKIYPILLVAVADVDSMSPIGPVKPDRAERDPSQDPVYTPLQNLGEVVAVKDFGDILHVISWIMIPDKPSDLPDGVSSVVSVRDMKRRALRTDILADGLDDIRG